MSDELPHIQAVIDALRKRPWSTMNDLVVDTGLVPYLVTNAVRCLRHRCAMIQRADEATPEERLRFKRAVLLRYRVVDNIPPKSVRKPVPKHCQSAHCGVPLRAGGRGHYCPPCAAVLRNAGLRRTPVEVLPPYINPIRARFLGLPVAARASAPDIAALDPTVRPRSAA